MNHPFLANLLRRNESSTGFRLAPLRFSFASCSIPSKCMNNLREKVLGTHVKRDTPKAPRFAGFVLWVPCLLKKVSQTNHPPWPDSFILRFHDLAFLHFRRFRQVGSLVTVQTWQRTLSWWFHVISQFSRRWSTLIFISFCVWRSHFECFLRWR